jgi:hypothetical protein
MLFLHDRTPLTINLKSKLLSLSLSVVLASLLLLHGGTPPHHQSQFDTFFILFSLSLSPSLSLSLSLSQLSGLVMWCVLYDLLFMTIWNLKTYLRNALGMGQVRLLMTAPTHQGTQGRRVYV